MFYHRAGWIFLSVLLLLLAGCQAAAPATTPAAVQAYAWPLPPLSAEQTQAARACDPAGLAYTRYPEALEREKLAGAYSPKDGCDWAALAAAYAARREQTADLPPEAYAAFAQATSQNYGLALKTELFYNYFGGIELVQPADFSKLAVTKIELAYDWTGQGDPVSYQITIEQSGETPLVKVRPAIAPAAATLAPEKVQAFRQAFTNLLPVATGFSLMPCADSYPFWLVKVTFEGGKSVEAVTDSNFMTIGGPWFVQVDEQLYIQYNSAFGDAVYELVTALGLPLGAPAGISCRGTAQNVFSEAYPER